MSSRIVLDLKNFRHVKTDKDMTTLEHKKDKHQISLHHPSLSPESQAQLKALAGIGKSNMTASQAQEAQDQAPKRMAEGGYTSTDTKQPIPKQPPAEPKPQPTRPEGGVDPSSPFKTGDWNIWGKAKGGQVQQYAEGTPDNTVQPPSIPGMPSPEQQQAMGSYMDKPGPPDSVSQALGFSQPPQATPGVKMPQQAEQEQRAAELAKVLPQAQDQQAPDPALDQSAPPTQASAPPEQPNGMEDYYKEARDALGEQQKGLEKRAEAASEQGVTNAATEIGYRSMIKAENDRFQAATAKDMQNIDNTVADMNANHINPRHYQENMDTGSKIRTAIGLMLGGMGAGLTHGPNLAAEFFNKQIDRDIAAQQNNQNIRQTVLGAYQNQYKNHQVATLMARATLQAKYGSQIMQAAAEAATPQAQATMLQEGGKLKMQAADLTRQATMMRLYQQSTGMGGVQQGASNDPEAAYQKQQQALMNPALMIINPELAKHNMEIAKANAERHVRGVGDAPPGTVIPEAVRNQIASHKSVNDLMNMSLDLSKQYGGSLKGMAPSIIARANTLHGQLIGSVKQAQHDGVYKPSEAAFLLDQIGDSPASMFANFSSVPKVREMQDIKQSEYNNLTDVWNLPRQELQKGGSQVSNQSRDAALAWAKAQPPGDPKAKKILEIINKR